MEEFIVDYRLNKEFDLLAALNIAVEGTGAGLLFSGLLFGLTQAVAAGLVLVFIGIIALFLDLGRPAKFWRAIFRARSAWISRGSFFIGTLVMLTLLILCFPSVKGTPLGTVIQICAGVFALLTMVYTGFLLSSMTPIPFWNTPLVPILFLLSSLTSGMTILLSLQSLVGDGHGGAHGYEKIVLGLLTITLLFTIIYIWGMATATNAARFSTHLLLAGQSRLLFFGGVIVLGYLLPLFFVGIVYLSDPTEAIAANAALLAAALSRLLGDFFLRYAVLKVGAFEPPI